MGILLMFVFGLRNAEACAITFGNIMEINGRSPSLAAGPMNWTPSCREPISPKKHSRSPFVIPLINTLPAVATHFFACVVGDPTDESVARRNQWAFDVVQDYGRTFYQK